MEVAHLIAKNNQYYCSNCLMRQDLKHPYCQYCGRLLTNWEDIIIELMKYDPNITDKLMEGLNYEDILEE